MSPEEGNGNEAEQRARRLRFRIAFFLTSLVALGVVVTLPFSVKSVVDDILGPVTGRVVKITRNRPDAAHPDHTKLHPFVSIDETSFSPRSVSPDITCASPATGAIGCSSSR